MDAREVYPAPDGHIRKGRVFFSGRRRRHGKIPCGDGELTRPGPPSWRPGIFSGHEPAPRAPGPVHRRGGRVFLCPVGVKPLIDEAMAGRCCRTALAYVGTGVYFSNEEPNNPSFFTSDDFLPDSFFISKKCVFCIQFDSNGAIFS